MMQDCYSKIVEKLASANPTMVVQVRTHARWDPSADIWGVEQTPKATKAWFILL